MTCYQQLEFLSVSIREETAMKIRLLLLLLSLPAALMIGCSRAEIPETASAEPIIIVTTIFPLADLIKDLGGDRVEVSYLLPTGASPHTFEPTTEQARQVADARLFVYVGAGLDDWALKLSEIGSGELKVLELAHDVELLEGHDCDDHEHGHDHEHQADPHFWLDPILVSNQLLPRIYEELCLIAPELQPLFDQNLIAIQGKLTALDQEITTTLASTNRKDFIAFHSAWHYFAARYGLNELAVVASFPGQEPSAGWIAELIEIINEHDVGAILVEPQFSQNLATAIAAETGIKILTVDPLGGENLPDRGSYLDLMRYNLIIFFEALQ
jgi:zinc transport system substrate-binding protein